MNDLIVLREGVTWREIFIGKKLCSNQGLYDSIKAIEAHFWLRGFPFRCATRVPSSEACARSQLTMSSRDRYELFR